MSTDGLEQAAPSTLGEDGLGQSATVGLLFVHGIGTQSRGRTLTAFAAPMVVCLTAWYDSLHDRWVEHGLRFEDAEAWLEAQDPTDARLLDVARSLLDRLPRRAPGEDAADVAELASKVSDTLAVAVRLIAEEADEDAPSCARLEVTRIGVHSGIRRTSWLLAESWWAESFAPPSFGELARWGVGIVARTIGSHFGVRVRRGIDRLRRRPSASPFMWLAVALCQLLLAVYASLLALAGLGLLLLLGALPIPRLRSGVTRLQLALADSLGDSYVLVTQPVQAAAMVGRVRRDLGWLADRSAAIAVVAHSQGAAVVNEVLRQELAETDPARRVLPDPKSGRQGGDRARGQMQQLVTLGSGLRKLDELRRLLGPHRHFRRSALLTVAGAAVFSLATLGLALPYTRTDDGWAGVVLLAVYAAVGLGLLGAGMADMVTGTGAKELRWWAARLRRTGIAWTDYAASADPVPNGRLFADDMSFPEHQTIHNRRSVLGDHAGYWANTEEFVTDLLIRLARLDPEIAADLDDHDELFAFARRRRRWRVAWLLATRWVATIAGLAVLVRGRDVWLPQLGHALSRLLNLAGIGGPAAPVEVRPVLAALAPAAAIGGAYLLAVLTWRAWDGYEGRQLLARRRPGSGSADAWFLGAATIVALTALAVGVPQFQLESPWAVAVFISLMALWFATQLRADAFAGSADKVQPAPGTRADAFVRRAWSLASIGAMVLGYGLIGAIAWRGLSRSPQVGAVVVAAVVLFSTLSLVRAWRRRRAGTSGRRG